MRGIAILKINVNNAKSAIHRMVALPDLFDRTHRKIQSRKNNLLPNRLTFFGLIKFTLLEFTSGS